MVLRSEAFGFAFFKTMQSKLASDWSSSCLHSSGAGITGMHSHTFRKSIYLDENMMVELTGSVSLSQEEETTVPCLTLSAPGSWTSCPPVLRMKPFKLPSLWVLCCNSPKWEQQLPASTPLKPKVKGLWPVQQPAPTSRLPHGFSLHLPVEDSQACHHPWEAHNIASKETIPS